MSDEDLDGDGHQQREQTDESLRVERHRADTTGAAKRAAAEDDADQVVRTARRLADGLMKTAREDADRERRPPATASEASARQGDRTRADLLLEDQRSGADAVLRSERVERVRYLADFLAVEREATDQDLIRERDHADSVVAQRDEFLATVSHDLRSLLGGLSMNAALMGNRAPLGPEGDELRRHAARSQRLVARMNRLISDLLDIVSIEAGQLALLPEPVQVGKILGDTLEAFESIAAAKHITLALDAPALPLEVSVDEGRILQVLANLVSNAIKFTPAEGRVSIAVEVAGGEIRFAVSDNGIGIASEALPEVFDRFRQVSADRRGLGLGLHISKCIVEAHGGRMWAESAVAVGSTFHFALPAATRTS